MSEWKEYKLGDVAEFKTGKLNSNAAIESGKYPFFTCSPETLKINDYAFDCEALLLAGNNAEGVFSLKYYKGKFNAYQRTYVITIPENRNADYKFLFYNLQTQLKELQNISFGSATRFLTLTILNEIKIKLPDLPEQKSIASILSSLDDKIDLLHRQNKTLEALAETLFRQWFVEEAEEGWEKGKLGDVISVKGGTTPSTTKPEFWNGNFHWTSPKDLSNNNSIYLFNTERKITEKGLEQIGSGLLPIGTVLLSSRAPIGYLVITEIPVAINQGYIAIICDKLVSNYFIYLWTKKNLETIISAANGSVFLEISKSTFKELDFTIPPKEKLKLFDKEIKPLFQKTKSNTNQIRTLTRLRDTLLPKLMSGKVRVEYENN